MEIDEAAKRVSYCLNIGACVVNVSDGDVVAISIDDLRGENPSGSLTVVFDLRTIRKVHFGPGHPTVGLSPGLIIDKRAVRGMGRKKLVIIAWRAIETMPGSVSIDDHGPGSSCYAHHLAKTERPTRRRPVTIDIEVDLSSSFIPDARVVGQR